MLDADRQANHVFRYAGLFQLFGRELAVGGAGRVAGERFGVADVDQTRDQLQRILEARAGFAAALDAEGQQARCLAAEIAVDERLARVVGQAGIVDPFGLRVPLQEFGDFQRVFAVALHAQRQRFQPLQNQEGVERRQAGAHRAQRDGAGAADVGGVAECLGVDHAVVADFRFAEALEARLVFGPRELARVDDDAGDAGSVAAHVLGQRVDDDVGAVLERAGQIGAWHSVVDDQRHAVRVGDRGKRGEIDDVAERVADRFAVDGLGTLVDQLGRAGRIVRIAESHLDAVLRQRVREQVVGAAVQRRSRDDVVAGFGQRHDRRRDRGQSRRERQRADAAFQCGHALFKHGGGRIADARVNVARHFQVEQVGAVLRVVERVAGGLVDRHRDGLLGRVGGVAGVDG